MKKNSLRVWTPFDPDSVLNLPRKVEQFHRPLFPRCVSAVGCARSRCNIPAGTCAKHIWSAGSLRRSSVCVSGGQRGVGPRASKKTGGAAGSIQTLSEWDF